MSTHESSAVERAVVDYRAVFAALTAPKVVLSPGFMILDANVSFLEAVERPRRAVVGRHLLDAFPPSPGGGRSAAQIVTALERAARSGRLEMLGPHRYDLPDGRGGWKERWWIATNVPVPDPGGHVAYVVLRAEDVTDLVSVAGRMSTTPDTAPSGSPVSMDPAPGGEVLEHALVVGSTVERFASAFERERRSALELQDSILTQPPQSPGLHLDVRYRPAAPEVHVGGDWYDAFLLPGGEMMVVIGDVSGHDVSAAAAMAQLRGVIRTVGYGTASTPAAVLDESDRIAHGLDLGAIATVGVVRIDPRPPGESRPFVWSSAGHLPPLVRHVDGRAELLPLAPGMLLGFGVQGTRKNQESTLAPGDTLLLFTDGLVERRDLPLRESLEQLPRVVEDLGDVPPDGLLDALFAALVPAGADDDVAALAVHLDDSTLP